jgi:hypothetical protein
VSLIVCIHGTQENIQNCPFAATKNSVAVCSLHSAVCSFFSAHPKNGLNSVSEVFQEQMATKKNIPNNGSQQWN